MTVAAYIEQLGAEMAKPSPNSIWPPSGSNSSIITWLLVAFCRQTRLARWTGRSMW